MNWRAILRDAIEAAAAEDQHVQPADVHGRPDGGGQNGARRRGRQIRLPSGREVDHPQLLDLLGRAVLQDLEVVLRQRIDEAVVPVPNGHVDLDETHPAPEGGRLRL